ADPAWRDARTRARFIARVPRDVARAGTPEFVAAGGPAGRARARLSRGSRWMGAARNALGAAHAGRGVCDPPGQRARSGAVAGGDSPRRGGELRHLPLPRFRAGRGVPRGAVSRPVVGSGLLRGGSGWQLADRGGELPAVRVALPGAEGQVRWHLGAGPLN